MTEEQWLSCNDPTMMLDCLLGKANERKLRLFASTCARRVWRLLESSHLRYAVEVLECYAEGTVSLDCLQDAQSESHPLRIYHDELFSRLPNEKKWFAAYGVNRVLRDHLGVEDMGDVLDFFALAIAAVECESLGKKERLSPDAKERFAQADRMREIFGNPFCSPPHLHPSVLAWNDDTLRRIAEGIYHERQMPEGTLDKTRLAILADALLDAGCDNEGIIAHCRQPGEHVRGCYVIDLLTGRE